jgi:putative heme iron utilization protein
MCSAKAGHRAEAIATYREALALLPEHARAEIALPLAELMWSTDRREARSLALAAIDDRGPGAAEARAWLAAHPAP